MVFIPHLLQPVEVRVLVSLGGSLDSGLLVVTKGILYTFKQLCQNLTASQRTFCALLSALKSNNFFLIYKKDNLAVSVSKT